MSIVVLILSILCVGIAADPLVPVYVINLEHRPARLQRFRQRFDELDLGSVLDLRIVRATNASEAQELLNNKTVSIRANYVDPVHKRPMKLGEIGCAHSHYRVFQNIADDKEHDWAVVLEDDAVLSEEFAARFKDWRKLSSPSRDVVFYAHKKMDAETNPKSLGHGLEEFVYSYWALAYAVTREAAKQLADESYLQNIVPSDEYLPAMLLESECDVAGVCDRRPQLRGASYQEDLAVPENFGDTAFSDTELSDLVDAKNNAANTSFDVYTVATDTNHFGFRALERSALHFGVKLTVLDSSKEWQGGEMFEGTGGGQKLTSMRKALEKEEDKDRMVIFTDGYDTLIVKSAAEIAALLEKHVPPGTVMFATERHCWPERGLAKHYPEVEDHPYRFLNSGNYAGRVRDILALIDDRDERNPSSDDQLYFTKVFLGGRSKIRLDYDRVLFQTLSGIDDDEWFMKERGTRFARKDGRPSAAFLHGNGDAKELIAQISNYEAGAWSSFYGSMWRPLQQVDASDSDVLESSTVLLAVLCRNSPFADQFQAALDTVQWSGPKTTVLLWRHKDCALSERELRSKFSGAVDIIDVAGFSAERAKNIALQHAQDKNIEHVFFVESSVLFKRRDVLAQLLRDNLPAVAPHAQQPGDSVYSNYWLSATNDGWYKRSFNSLALYKREQRGLWQARLVMSCVLVRSDSYSAWQAALEKCELGEEDHDVCVSRALWRSGSPVYVDNRHDYAELLESEKRAHTGDSPTPDLFEAEANPTFWDRAYLNDTFLAGNASTVEICPDVFGVRLFNERFCSELVSEMERFGQWSSGKNDDPRIAGGYENVPTQDIHTKQIGWEESWVSILKRHVYPEMYRLYAGSTFKEELNIAFVVRYITTGQYALRPHQDAAAITTVTTLSSEFEGGGARFTRYNCTHVSKTPGMTAFHPGRITHQHEGLPITSGRRYILVSFNE